MLFLHLIIHVAFIFHFIDVICYIYWFACVELVSHPRDKFHLVMVQNSVKSIFEFCLLMSCWQFLHV